MSMTKGTRPIDANNLARRIREYMDDFPNATTRLATCRAILSMLGDEKQTPTLRPITREQVICCKDCRYWQDNNGGYPHPECRWAKDETPNADDYCSFAERLEENKDG